MSLRRQARPPAWINAFRGFFKKEAVQYDEYAIIVIPSDIPSESDLTSQMVILNSPHFFTSTMTVL